MYPNRLPVKIVYLDNYVGNPLELAMPGDSGYDLRAAELPADMKLAGYDKWIIAAGGVAVIPTGIKVAVPTGWEMQVRTRSGSALKKGFIVANSPGTVDSGYRGEVGVIVYNFSHKPVFFEPGERIAQGVFTMVFHADFQMVEELNETERGTGAYNSTGVK
jgi:dUTP pyrophosphatase